MSKPSMLSGVLCQLRQLPVSTGNPFYTIVIVLQVCPVLPTVSRWSILRGENGFTVSMTSLTSRAELTVARCASPL